MPDPQPAFLFEKPILVEHLNAAIQVIGLNTEAYYSGALHAYRPIAAELRKLLCDYQRGRNISLLPQCFPGVQLHVLVGSPDMIDEHTTLYIPCRMYFDGKGGSDITQLFNETGPMLGIGEWLDQKLFNKDVTLRELIKSVADKEGAHADDTHNNTLLLTKSVRFPGDESLAAKAIIAIARYVVGGIAIRSLIATGESKRALEAAKQESSRGVVVMALRDTCRSGIHQIPLSFVPQERAGELATNPEEAAALAALIDQYDLETTFLLMAVDLNGRGRTVYGIRA